MVTIEESKQAQQLAEPVQFQLEWGTLRGLAWGKPSSKPILALHGWLDNAHSFLPIAAAFLKSPLAQQRQLIAIDWAGHGLSDHRPAGNYYPFIDYVYDLYRLIRQQDWSNVDVIAHSMGAFVANIYAGVDNDRIDHLLAIEAFGLLTYEASDTRATMLKAFASRTNQQDKHRPHYPSVATGVKARQQAGDFGSEYAELLVARGIEKLADNDYRFRADGYLRVPSAMRLTKEQVSDILQGIKCSYHLILGSNGHKNLIEAVSAWKHCVPQLQQFELSGGHHVHMEQPDATIAVFERMINTTND